LLAVYLLVKLPGEHVADFSVSHVVVGQLVLLEVLLVRELRVLVQRLLSRRGQAIRFQSFVPKANDVLVVGKGRDRREGSEEPVDLVLIHVIVDITVCVFPSLGFMRVQSDSFDRTHVVYPVVCVVTEEYV